jgi:uncharacterized protein YjbJ (UPF0337 family)
MSIESGEDRPIGMAVVEFTADSFHKTAFLPSKTYEHFQLLKSGMYLQQYKQETIMNQDQMQGKFEQVKGKIKETWGRLSDSDISLANGKKEQFFGKLQEAYGLTLEDAQKHFEKIEKSCDGSSDKVA